MSTRRLAAIMFTDIVGYTAMMQRNEQEGLAKVRHFSKTMEEQVKSHHGEILQFMGDGCLCIFNSAVEAMHAAKNIQESLQAEPKVPLRIGIHIGDIVIQEGNIYGDGVNLASRVESMGVPGSILVTERVIHDVKSHPEFDMTSLGKFQFKNVEKPIEVFALANEGFAVPEPDQMKGKGEKIDSSHSRYLQSYLAKSRGLFLVGLVILSLLFWGILSIKQNKKNTNIENLEKSIVVLPFANKSEEANTDYFSDGITEDILIQLSKLKNLKVISQTSAMRYKGSEKTLKEIADELNVNFVLQGSVRKIGYQVRISAQLIHAEEDINLWVDQYDFELKDVFEIQSQVSRSIADQLKAQISSEEQEELEQIPTNNQQAYQLYLRGRQLIKSRKLESIETAESLFEQALNLDSNFVHARAELATIYYLKGNYFFKNTDSLNYYDKALEISEAILKVNPKIVRAYDIQGQIFRHRIEYDKSIEYFIEGLRLNPEDEELLNHTALLLSDIGRNEEAMFVIKKVIKIDPLSPITLAIYIRILTRSLNFEQAWKQFEAAKKLFPNNRLILSQKIWIYLWQRECDQLANFIEEELKTGSGKQNIAFCYCMEEDQKKANKYLKSIPEENIWKAFFEARLNRDNDAMFNLLMNDYKLSNPILLSHPAFEVLQNDTRFESYLSQSPFGQVGTLDVRLVMELVR